MPDSPTFDKEAAHKFFSANCFNAAWEYIDKAERTAEEDEMMIGLAHASVWHWTQRTDCAETNMSIGYWQLSRVYALAGMADNARRYGQLCLDTAPADQPFFVGYAYEALARAESVAGNAEKSNEYLAQAKEQAASVTDAEDKKLLDDDLGALSES